MNLHLIVPDNMNEMMKRTIYNQKSDQDRIDVVELKDGTNEIKNVIKKSSYDNFVIFSGNFSSKSKFLKKAKEKMGENNVFLYTEEHEEGTVSNNSFIGFQKGKEDIIDKNYRSSMLFIRRMFEKLSSTETNKVQFPASKKKSYPKPRKNESTRPRKEDTSPPTIRNNTTKPKILFVCDVKGGAWGLKSEYIQKYLSDEFHIDVINTIGEGRQTINPNTYDLYFTYGYSFISSIKKVPFNRRITGVTAHRPLSYIKSKMQQAYAVHANSILLLNELKGIHNNCYYLPNGVDTTKFYPKETGRKNIVFGHVGKLSPQKGQKKFLEPATTEANVRYYPHYNNYKDKIPHNKMVDVYRNLDVFLVSSFEDGTPCPALEAAACGKPIISNRVGNMPEFIVDGWNGFLVNQNKNDYIEKMNYFKEHPEEIIRMGRNARITAEKGDWSKAVDNYRYMFKDILQMS